MSFMCRPVDTDCGHGVDTGGQQTVPAIRLNTSNIASLKPRDATFITYDSAVRGFGVRTTPGVTLYEVGALLGHSDVATTSRYAHLTDATLRRATEKVGKTLPRLSSPRRL